MRPKPELKYRIIPEDNFRAIRWVCLCGKELALTGIAVYCEDCDRVWSMQVVEPYIDYGDRKNYDSNSS